MTAHRVMVVVGTRPEVIKMAPVVRELQRWPTRFETVLVSTAQHRELLAQALDAFDLRPAVDLELMSVNQGLGDFAARCLTAITATLHQVRPHAVLVQGDTTTVTATALAATYQQIRVGHVEAGLRSHDRDNPFPEELNRRVASTLADLHFAPTGLARENLLHEGVKAADIVVTGNTIVDALRSIRVDGRYESAALNAVPTAGRRLLLLTVHRRENHGPRLASVCLAARRLVERFPDIELVVPLHLNPNVRAMVEAELGAVARVHLVEPASYADLLRLLDRAFLVLTDSGGIQEEAPSFHTPVLILRDVTERPEVVDVGAGMLVGTEPDRIVTAASRLLRDPAAYSRMSAAENPFGDGHAAQRIVAALSRRLASVDVALDPKVRPLTPVYSPAVPAPSGLARRLVAGISRNGRDAG
jgi:UDP-N-acetylglucosamine 2-epimerase (non-hydrolysing)